MRPLGIFLLLAGTQALPSFDSINMDGLAETLYGCAANTPLGSDLMSAYESCNLDFGCTLLAANWVDGSGEPLVTNIMEDLSNLPARNSEEAASCRVLEALMSGEECTATAAPPTGQRQVFPMTTSNVPGHKMTLVFGVPVIGHCAVTDEKLQHAASVLAEWLDNNEDGCVDNEPVRDEIVKRKGVFLIALGDGTDGKMDFSLKATHLAGWGPSLTVREDYILPECAGKKSTPECRDETLEEILHLVTGTGYAPAYPSVFGFSNDPSSTSSKLTKAMDKARGGQFATTPSSYPSKAWYTYVSDTCTYSCQVNEYIFWGVSAYTDTLEGLKGSIEQEWSILTKKQLRKKDKRLYRILKDTKTYRMPTKAPDGKYLAPNTCPSSSSSGGLTA